MTHPQSPEKQRFVSLYGYFAFEYPAYWKQETDEQGHYVLYNENGGAGVLRIIVMEHEQEGETGAAKILEDVFTQNQEFEPVVYVKGENKFVHFVKEHAINGGNFTVHYWITAHADKMVLFTLTLQTVLKELPAALKELEQMENLIATVEFLQGHDHHHEHTHDH
ncbi:MAG: DUF3805 domain-containing protein [Bacteroidia bacterium]|jgi:hypothetical protein